MKIKLIFFHKRTSSPFSWQEKLRPKLKQLQSPKQNKSTLASLALPYVHIKINYHNYCGLILRGRIMPGLTANYLLCM